MNDDNLKYFNDKNYLLEFNIVENNNMSSLENFKIKIVNTHLKLYKKFPTLHSIRCFHYSTAMGLAQKGWNARVNQVAWDTVQNICEEEDYKKEKLIMYAYLGNRIKKMNDEALIPMKEDNAVVKIKYDELADIVKKELSYLNDMETELKQQLVSQQEDKKQSPSIYLFSRDWYGHKGDFKKEIDNFFGQEMMKKINYLKMNEVFPDKPTITSLKRTKI